MNQTISISFFNNRQVQLGDLRLLGVDTIDGKSRKKVYALFESGLLITNRRNKTQ